MNDYPSKLISCLREELQQYGEMLARLDDQQQWVMQRAPDQVLNAASLVQTQGLVMRQARNAREAAQSLLASSCGLPADATVAQIITHLPDACRPLVLALVQENNELLTRVRQRARQNHLLLSKSVELLRELIDSLVPGARSPVYGENGSVYSARIGARSLYEAVG